MLIPMCTRASRRLPFGLAAVLLAAAALLAAPAPGRAGDVTVSVEAERREVYLGEPLRVTVKVDGDLNPAEPDLQGIRGASLRLLDSRSQSFENVTIVNGRMQRTGFRGRIFTYELTPETAGSLLLGPVHVDTAGGTVSVAGPRVLVREVPEQNDVRLRILPSRREVLVDEPFTVTLVVGIRRLPPPFDEADPLPRGDGPMLSIPWLSGEPDPGIEGPDVQALLQGLLTDGRRQPGFGINRLTVRNDPFTNPFNFESLTGEQMAQFALHRHEARTNGVDYLEYELPVRYVPAREGDYRFGPVTLNGSILTDVDAAGRSAAQRRYAVAPAVTVRVVPPPRDGRPATYIGAIGTNLVVDAALDTQECRVGDPLRLTLRIAGDVRLDNLRLPPFTDLADLARDFRVYADTVETRADDTGRTYTCTLRPIHAGTIEIPPLQVSWYDTAERRYRTVSTAPIPIRVQRTAQVAADFILAATNTLKTADHRPGPLPLPVTLAADGPAPRLPLLRLPHLLVLAGMPFLAAVGALLRLIRRLRRASAPARHRRRLAREGRRLVAAAADRTVAPRERRRRLQTGWRRFLAARLATSETALDAAQARRLLDARRVPPELAAEAVALLEQGAAQLYAPDEETTDQLDREAVRARHLLHRLRRLLPAILLLGGLLTGGTPARADDVRMEHWFLWEEGNSLMANARDPSGFTAAAAAYHRLLAAGVENGALYRNLGTALLMAGRGQEAARALRAAEILEGSSPALRAAMAAARQTGSSAGTPSLPWYRLPLFWHYRPALGVRLAVATAGYACLWLAVLLRLGGWRRAAGALAAPAAAVAILFGSSAAASWHTLTSLRAGLQRAVPPAAAAPASTPDAEAAP